jgi:hypothetical protein
MVGEVILSGWGVEDQNIGSLQVSLKPVDADQISLNPLLRCRLREEKSPYKGEKQARP